MNYVLLYRELIRQRLEDFRLSQGWHKHDMAEQCLIQPTDYSGILKNSRVIDSQNKTKNNHKYMLSSGEAALFARRMGTDIYGIVWGTPRDKETIVKLILLGIITNGPSDGQRKKLERSGLGRFFTEDRITVSGDYPFKKPDPRLFQEGCRKLGVRPEEAVYVGDLFYRDVLGSANAGMTPVWIWNWGERKCGTDILIIHKISDLLDYF